MQSVKDELLVSADKILNEIIAQSSISAERKTLMYRRALLQEHLNLVTLGAVFRDFPLEKINTMYEKIYEHYERDMASLGKSIAYDFCRELNEKAT